MRNAFWIAAGLAALAAPTGPQGQPVVDVELSNFRFTPKTIILDHGRAYVFRLRNTAGGGHDFTARDFFSAAAISPEDRRWIADGEVEVPPGQQREITLTAPAAGRYQLKCTHRFHKVLGMSGTIIVR